MTGLPSLRYPQPDQRATATAWAQDWRRRWFRQVGTVYQHPETGELVALYSDSRDPTARLTLQQELEQHPAGIGQVLAACRKAHRDFDRTILDANRRHRASSTEGR